MLHVISLKTFGNSMLPLLHSGDIVYFKKVPFSSLRNDDIIVISSKKHFITHRVIYKTPSYVITKGDNNPYTDGKIRPKQIVGRVYQIKRWKDIFPVDTLSLIQNASYLSEISSSTTLFKKQTIDFIFLKGMPVFLHYTKLMPKRIFADCDIMVAGEDFDQAKSLLLDNGYYQKKDAGFIASLFRRFSMEEDFFKQNPYLIMIDLHQRPFSYIRKIDIPDALYPKKLMDEFVREMLSTKRWVTVRSTKIPIASKNYLLAFLCIHFFTHTMKMIHRVQLISILINKEFKTEKSWEEFGLIVRKYQLAYMIYPALYYARAFYNTPIPKSVLRLIKPSGAVMSLYNLKKDLVFDERVDATRIMNKLHISWTGSPNPLWKKMTVFISPAVVVLLLFYFRHVLVLVFIALRQNLLRDYDK